MRQWHRVSGSAALGAFLFFVGCGGNSDFHLPLLAPGGNKVTLEWHVLPTPVFSRVDKGDWDGEDALNPSVVRFGNRMYNVYSGYDGKTWRSGVAASLDGTIWT